MPPISPLVQMPQVGGGGGGGTIAAPVGFGKMIVAIPIVKFVLLNALIVTVVQFVLAASAGKEAGAVYLPVESIDPHPMTGQSNDHEEAGGSDLNCFD